MDGSCPGRGANPIEAHARLFNYPPVSAIRSLEDAAAMGFKAIFFSNSFGAYRRTALEQVGGFPKESNFGEVPGGGASAANGLAHC